MLRIFNTLLILLSLVATPAIAADSAVVNHEGYWWLSSEGDNCAAAIEGVAEGAMLAVQRNLTAHQLWIGAPPPARGGLAGVVAIDEAAFSFRPRYENKRALIQIDDGEGQILDAMRSGRHLSVSIDGQMVFEVGLEGTGVASALDGVAACARGESGWWGRGIGGKEPEAVYNKEDVWALGRTAGPEGCVALASADGRSFLTLVGRRGEIYAGYIGKGRLKGSEAWLETDTVVFKFKPRFADDELDAETPLDALGLNALRTSKALTLGIGRKVIVDLDVRDSGLPALVSDLIACSKGQSGWWGEGAAGLDKPH